jgi:Tol biopolymer transport system component/DNA-binding winged helix-turn-helix (wHTH) protein
MQGDFRIGERLIQPRINSVQHEGGAVHLEPKVMQVLLVLASNPGEVFTREEIRKVVWRDVFVGDDVLMRAVSEIRRVFEDDPRMPHTIQTVPKVGYRLIAAVGETVKGSAFTLEGNVHSPENGLAFPNGSVELASEPLPRFAETPLKPSRHLHFGIAAAITAVLLVSVALVVFFTIGHASQSVPSFISHPLTTYPGSQLEPALSPGGDAVAFVWNQSGRADNHLYVKALKSGAPVRVTSGEDQEYSPAWSPDGLSLAFFRHSESATTVEVIPALGGSERQVYTLPVNSVWEYGGLTWSSDGAALIFPEQRIPGGASRLVELSLNNHATRFLTTPSSNWNGDSMPAVSPDGKMLAFARGSEQSTRDIFVMKLPDGTPHQLTTDAHLILGLVWTPGGSSIVFSSNRGGSLGLWRVSANGGPPERDLAGTDGAYWPTVSKHGDLLAYSHGSASWSIASIPLETAKPKTEVEVLTSSEQDSSPQISPTGTSLAFQSWRSGTQEIWTSGVDGSEPIQLTNQGADAGSPAWSRDGRLVAFDARPQGFPHIYVTDIGGASPRVLTSGNFNDIVPSWSADGRWIYFGSNRSGRWQIWRVASDGQDSPQQVTSGGGMVAKESADGKWTYYTQDGTPGLWRRSIQGGPEQKIFDGPSLGNQDYWTVFGNDLYVLSSESGSRNIVHVDPETGQARIVYTLKHDPAPFAGLTVSPGGKQLLFAELLEARSNITLVEHFR